MTSYSHVAAPSLALTARPSPGANEILSRLTDLYSIAQRSEHVFASPLGPFVHQGRSTHVPRFAFFGPHASEVSWRLAILGGFDHHDLRSSAAVLGLLEDLASNAADGFGLHLTFLPIVDAAGFFLGAPRRPLSSAHWARSDAPEIGLLERDARSSGYHGFVRVETAPADEEIITIAMRAPTGLLEGPDVELITSDETQPFAVTFERSSVGQPPGCGPLSIADDYTVGPFELTLRVPAHWTPSRYQHAVRTILHRFILRYRGFQGYAQHL